MNRKKKMSKSVYLLQEEEQVQFVKIKEGNMKLMY